jgi:2-octaprenyl-6-methoxyphenol hydroxylase
MHRTGHWLGLDVHDAGEYKVGGEWRPLSKPGMVLTVEPGLLHPPRRRRSAGLLEHRHPHRGRRVATNIGAESVIATIRRNGIEQQIHTQLIVHAEGISANAADVSVRDYHQHAVLAEVRPAPAHGHRAWERFTPDGPLALLPLGEDYSVVFTVPPEKADLLMQMNDAAFLAALQQQFGTRLRFTATSPRARYPLALRLRKNLCSEREVWIGNAAQTLHPVSGQGFNLGIRDAWELAEVLLAPNTAYPGEMPALDAYSRGRQFDRRGSAAFTDGIVRAFSNDFPPLRVARGLGLLALDLCPAARQFVAGRMIWGARAWP